jgi:hypothetical protein
MGTAVPSPVLKRPGREADPSTPASVEVNNEWSYTSMPSIRLYGVQRDTCTVP